MTGWTAFLIAILFWVIGVPVLILVVKFIGSAWKWSVGKPVSTGVVHPRIDNRQVIPVQTLPDTIPRNVRGNAVCSPSIVAPITPSRRNIPSIQTNISQVPTSTPSYTPTVRPRTRQRFDDTRVIYTWESMRMNDARAWEAMDQLMKHSSVTVKLGFKYKEPAYVGGNGVGYEVHEGLAWYTNTYQCVASHIIDKKYYIEMDLWSGSIVPGRYRLYKYSSYDMDVGDTIILEISCM